MRKHYTTTYTAKKEMLAIQESYLKLEGEKLPTWKIIDLALQFLPMILEPSTHWTKRISVNAIRRMLRYRLVGHRCSTEIPQRF